MDFNIHTDRHHYIWTWMASNNINIQSHFLRRRYEKLTYFLLWNGAWIGDSCQHALMFMSTFLLKSDGGTPQNVLMFLWYLCAPFIARYLKCKILASHRLSPEVFATQSISVNLGRIGGGQTISEAPTPVHDSYDTACWWETFYPRS